ncbi:putative NADPH2 dehydrogenase chain OYE2 [Serendipita vermifera]|nr:putative NADPH2 dehydrogenase chain OYE2 [Serendipita vermifera]
MNPSKLLSPIRVGRLDLAHRVVLAPLTRVRANSAHVHGDLAVTYYGQRASTPGTLLISEATLITPQASGFDNAPGIWSKEQIEAWKRITEAVHGNKSSIYLQLWALGRQAKPDSIKREGYPYVSSSDVALRGRPNPRPLSRDEVKHYVELYAKAAENAIEAGFDGVEIHGANGYLIDQFIQDVCNKRTDEYGGSIENRSRFALDVTKAVTSMVGEDRTAIRLSPWSEFGDMRMDDPIPTFQYLIQQLHDRFPSLAYLHLIESEIKGDNDAQARKRTDGKKDSNDFARKIWGDRPYISAGGYKPDTANRHVEKQGGLVAFGRLFLANPDLPKRIQLGAPLNAPNRKTFYTPGPVGYIDYPFLEDASKSKA